MPDSTASQDLFRASDDLGPEDLSRMLDLYCKTLRELSYDPVAYADTGTRLGKNLMRGTGKTDALCHAAWMCQETGKFIRQGRLDKAARWIGWIQGVLWTSGVFSLDELRGHNRYM